MKWNDLWPVSEGRELIERRVISLSLIVGLAVGSLSGKASAFRTIEESAGSGDRFDVSLEVNPDSGVFVYAVEERIPVGWSVEDISQGGLFDVANSTIKWGPYFDNGSREFRYSIVEPGGTGGAFSIEGTVSYDGNGVEVAGDSVIPSSTPFPIKLDPKGPNIGERLLPESIESGTPFEVRIEVKPPSETSVYAVEETPALGLEVLAIEEGGSFDASSGSVKWGPFFDNASRSLRYQVIWNGESVSRFEFLGTISVDGEGVTIGGAQSVLAAASSPEPSPQPQPEPPAGEAQAVRKLPGDLAGGGNLVVTIRMKPAAGSSAYALEERLPDGVSLVSADSGGQFDEASGALKWGPYFDTQERVVSYTLQVPVSLGGDLVFSGSISVDGVGEGIGGDQVLTVEGSDPPPSVSEFAARTLPSATDAGAVVTVSILIQPPSGISVYAVEEFFPAETSVMSVGDGGQVDAASGSIKWGPFFDNQTRTLRYELSIPESAQGDLPFRGLLSLDGQSQSVGGDQRLTLRSDMPAPGAGTESAERRLPDSAVAGGSLEVAIAVSPPSTISVYALEERVPQGATVTSVEGGGQWDQAAGTIKWGPYFDNQSRVLAYVLQLPSSLSGNVSFDGRLSLDGTSEAIGGVRELVVVTKGGNLGGDSAAQRRLPMSVGVGGDLDVSIEVKPPTAISVYAVEERIPDGAMALEIGAGGQFDAASGSIKWGPFFDTQERTLSYRLKHGQSAGGLLSFSGALSLDGESQSIGGMTSVSVRSAGEVPSPPVPPAGGDCLEGGGLLTFLNTGGLVRDVDGSLVGAGVFGQVYAGSDPNNLVPVCEPVEAFGNGAFIGGEMAVPGVAGGETVLVQLRAWKGAERFESATVRGASMIESLALKVPGALFPAPLLPTSAFSLQEVSDPPVLLPLRFADGVLTIEWSGVGRLQGASDPAGPYTDHPDQTNPQTVDVSANPFRFFRVVEP